MGFDIVSVKSIVKGVVSFLPGSKVLSRREGGGANSARYCYSVWLRHLVLAHQNGMRKMPLTVAELGPGDSLGIGIAALLSGIESYYAFDVVNYIRSEQNLKILDEMLSLFESRSPVPDEVEFPHLFPRISDYSFPCNILGNDRLAKSLSPARVNAVRSALKKPAPGSDQMCCISYSVPWDAGSVLREDSVDFILSQAVLEHVDDPGNAYSSMYRWLKPGGYISHEIDFKSHGTTRDWNGHWRYSDALWRVVCGRREYFLNREPLSSHLLFAESAGFELKFLSKVHAPMQGPRARFAPRFAQLDDDDLTTSSAYMLLYKNQE
jgi:SAM-dependent methyltransferase